jgi:hypothetical protein
LHLVPRLPKAPECPGTTTFGQRPREQDVDGRRASRERGHTGLPEPVQESVKAVVNSPHRRLQSENSTAVPSSPTQHDHMSRDRPAAATTATPADPDSPSSRHHHPPATRACHLSVPRRRPLTAAPQAPSPEHRTPSALSARDPNDERPNAGCLSVWSRLPCRTTTIPTIGAEEPSPVPRRRRTETCVKVYLLLSDLLLAAMRGARGTVLPVTVAAGGEHKPACPAEGL